MAGLAKTVKSEISKVNNSIEDVKKELTGVRNDFQSVQKEITTLKTNYQTVALDLSKAKADITGIESWIELRETSDKDAEAKSLAMGRKISGIQEELDSLKGEMTQSKKAYNDLKEYTLRLETQSRRDNLIFEGVEEREGETDRDVYDTIVRILSGMKIQNAQEIRIVRCHRLGPKSNNHPRPIIFKLHWFGDRTRIWEARRELKSFEGGKIFLAENFPPEIEKRRKILHPIMKAARSAEVRAFMSVDRLVVAGKSYTVDNLDSLPPKLDPKRLFTPTKNNVTAFFSSRSPLSNFYPVSIKDNDGTTYSSSEQMYQHRKALFHSDSVAASKILKASTAFQAYKAGKEVKGQNDSDWYKGAELGKAQMYKACLAKFKDNPSLCDFLLSTGDTQIAEGNPNDGLWGVKLSVKDPAIFDKDKWMGKNWMGDILSKIRDELR